MIVKELDEMDGKKKYRNREDDRKKGDIYHLFKIGGKIIKYNHVSSNYIRT